MDNKGKDSVADAPTACKRLKRTNSKDETCDEKKSDAAEAEAAVPKMDSTLPGKVANETENSHNNNNNCDKSKLECPKQQNSDTSKADNASENEASGMKPAGQNAGEGDAHSSQLLSPLNDTLTDNAADRPAPSYASDTSDSNPFLDILPFEARLLNAQAQRTAENDTENGGADVNSYIIFRPRVQRARSYRSTLSNMESSSSERSSNDLFDMSDTNDTDVDDDVDDDSVVSALQLASDDASRSPSADIQDDSSSHSSNGLWHHHQTSSNDDIDSDDNFNEEAETNPADKEQIEIAVNKVMGKSKPSYNWNFAGELMRREHNLFNRIGWRGGHTSTLSFSQGYYGSRQVVERMKLLNALSRHRCCVNCLSFNRTGDLICSGSDDLNIIVWDWANGKPMHTFKSGHSLNIFQSKFIDSAGCLDVVSSSRDGQVRRTVIPPSGSSSIKPMRLYSHNDAVHKLVVVPQSRHEVMSAGEDAAVKHFDLRTNTPTIMLRCVSSDGNRRVRLFSIAHHPYMPEFCVSGSDEKLRVYDKRKMTTPAHEMAPKDLKDTKITQITCAVYNHSGSEILASYSDAGIYLYDSRNYQDGEFLHSYEGHINSRTIKGVNFFGPHSEYIISGSDCGNIFFWEKNTEAVINFVKGDHSGVVNCLEQHPWMPVLATSGLDHNVKIWTPSGLAEPEVPRADALKETLQRNFRRSIVDVGDFDINQIHHFLRQLIHPRRNTSNLPSVGQGQRVRNRGLFSSSSSSSSSSSLSAGNAASINAEPLLRTSNPSSSDETNADPLGCRSQ